ncbi:hypothetical protein AMTR_s00072p00160170 [Amborella trichopoda]|uniref:Uncharacterized protein n=1 Tax=Amborella trichopoda TaxID=13333 RepID=W1NUX8_AMBTC|nr:hypothetical protein AMTR_s00072p00160170 [Amborella trichopoda]
MNSNTLPLSVTYETLSKVEKLVKRSEFVREKSRLLALTVDLEGARPPLPPYVLVVAIGVGDRRWGCC